jgi:hypothetical protein
LREERFGASGVSSSSDLPSPDHFCFIDSSPPYGHFSIFKRLGVAFVPFLSCIVAGFFLARGNVAAFNVWIFGWVSERIILPFA